MLVLLINTCGAEGIVALADEAQIVAEELLPGRGTSEHLMPVIRRILDMRGLRVRELGAIGVVIGPGSFTGVRVGLSAAKGLCEAGAVPMVAMSRLGLVAASAHVLDARHGAPGRGAETVALLDAGRGEYYYGAYSGDVCISEDLLPLSQTEALMAGRTAVTCEERVAEKLGAAVLLVAEPGAAAMLAMARNRIAAGAWSDVASVDANYLRRTDAELLKK